MNRKADESIKIRMAMPFEHDGQQVLNRRSRRAAAGRLRRAGVSTDPLAAFLRSRRGGLWLLIGVLLFAAVLCGIYLGKM